METIFNHGEKECLRYKNPGFNFRLNWKSKYKIIQIMENTITWITFAQFYSHLILRFHIDSLEIWMGFERTVLHIISLLILAVDGSGQNYPMQLSVESTVVRVMAWCRQATSRCLGHWAKMIKVSWRKKSYHNLLTIPLKCLSKVQLKLI